jgi:hypothetical protein
MNDAPTKVASADLTRMDAAKAALDDLKRAISGRLANEENLLKQISLKFNNTVHTLKQEASKSVLNEQQALVDFLNPYIESLKDSIGELDKFNEAKMLAEATTTDEERYKATLAANKSVEDLARDMDASADDSGTSLASRGPDERLETSASGTPRPDAGLGTSNADSLPVDRLGTSAAQPARQISESEFSNGPPGMTDSDMLLYKKLKQEMDGLNSQRGTGKFDPVKFQRVINKIANLFNQYRGGRRTRRRKRHSLRRK